MAELVAGGKGLLWVSLASELVEYPNGEPDDG